MAPPVKEQRQLWVLTSPLNPLHRQLYTLQCPALVSEHLKQPENLSGEAVGEAVLGAKTLGLPGTVS